MCNCLKMTTCSNPLPAAGNAFSQAARLHLQMQSKHDAATNFIDAGNAFKKADPQGSYYYSPIWGFCSCAVIILPKCTFFFPPPEAINCLNRAIEIYTDMVSLAVRLAVEPF